MLIDKSEFEVWVVAPQDDNGDWRFGDEAHICESRRDALEAIKNHLEDDMVYGAFILTPAAL